MDVSHVVGSDLSLGTTGDLAIAVGTDAVQQRVLRRLTTNPGGYIWQLSYGGGLASFIGSTVNASTIETVVRDQMALEAAVARAPVPVVAVAADVGGTVALTISYVDAATSSTQTFTITPGI